MLNFDRYEAGRILLQMEDKGYFDQLFRYKLYKTDGKLSLLGVGGTSFVYEMYDPQMPDRHFALKIIGLRGNTVDHNSISGLVKAQYSLGEQSDNILRIIDLRTIIVMLDDSGNVTEMVSVDEKSFDEAEGLILQMVLMEKLESIISKDKYGGVRLLWNDLRTEEGVLSFAQQIGSAIKIVHGNGYLHRDIKLENIFRDTKTGKYKLGDFGVARYIVDGNAETVLFTDGYGAPEIRDRFEGSYSFTADIYSFGISIYLLLNGLKFPGSDSYRVNKIQYEKDFILPAPEEGSEKTAGVIRKMCSYRPEERYQSVEEVLRDLEKVDEIYTDQGAIEKYEDAVTEVYSEDDEKEEILNEAEPTREERKRRSAEDEVIYGILSIGYLALFSVLFFLLFEAFSPDADYTGKWQFMIIPIALLIESVLQRMRVFQVIFGIMCLLLIVYSFFTIGMDIPLVIMMLVLFTGIPAVTAGCAVGTSLWISGMLFGNWVWPGFLYRWKLGWLFAVIITVLIVRMVFLRSVYEKKPSIGEQILRDLTQGMWL